MSENKKLIPKRRFKEFQNTDAWEQRELGTIMNLRKETGEPGQYTVDIELENLVTDMGQIVGDTSVRTQTNSVFRRGDTLFGRLRPYLNKWWLSDTDGVKSGEIWAFYPSEKNVEKFIYVLVQGKNFLDSANQSTGTKMPRADWNKVSTADVFIPDFKEQEKIGTFLSTLDQTIAFQQQKLEKMKSMKSAYLSEMFPAEGERKPKRRFPGFTDDWKQRELGKVLGNLTDGDWIEKEHISDKGKYRIIQTGNIGIGEYYNKGKDAKFLNQSSFDVLNGNEIFPGDILISRLAEPAGRTIILPNTGSRMVTAVDVAIVRPNSNFSSYFIQTMMNTNETLKKINEEASGSTRKRISRKNLELIDLIIPEIQEQEKIGNFFKNLDQTIAFQQQKLEKLQNIKKAYLNEMFI
ncbi:restriction endonuclease subunit S [Lactococcus lactis]|uniref:Type I restriction enzyme S subunit n=1 Tax=Lactococcus lactis TaxID=1358 RepID=A0AAW5TNN7_9LACT|nr:restriction endonuclease subunit S [Lactococcus lactis]MCW2279776.1 type I restriction enzyme S subunit [Lactococcus lactis]